LGYEAYKMGQNKSMRIHLKYNFIETTFLGVGIKALWNLFLETKGCIYNKTESGNST
jgi:hypothetical protein